MRHDVEENNNLLHKRGYRLTPQRYLVLSVIQDANDHISLDQIAERVQAINPRVSLSTVYRTLELLSELGIIHENHLPGKPPHYEIPRSNTHHHLVCQRCHTTFHLDDDLLGDLHELLQKQHHFHALSLSLLASGYCNNCWQKMQHEPQAMSLNESDVDEHSVE